MSEIADLLDDYLTRVTSLGAAAVGRLRPGASTAELDAAEERFGVELHPDVRAWYGWRNGLVRERARRSPGMIDEQFFPWGQQISLDDVFARDRAWTDAEDFLRGLRSQRPEIRIHDAGFPLVSALMMEISVECAPGPGFGAVWAHEIDNKARVLDPSLEAFIRRAIRFFDRGWIVTNREGGVSIAERDVLLAHVPPELHEAAGGMRWLWGTEVWGFDPLTDQPFVDRADG